MSLWTKVVGFLASAAPPPSETGGGRQTDFRESQGVNVDADDADWRRLSGDDARDLLPMRQDRMQLLAHHVWEGNLLANRLIELPLAYLLAKGVHIRVDDDASQIDLDRHWNDGINAWDIKLTKKLRELAMFGEQCWPVFIGAKGFVRVGYLDPSHIETVVTDPDNIEQPIGIIARTNRRGIKRRFRVIVNAPEDVFTNRTQEIRKTFSDGDAFFFKVNDLCSSTRGRSDLLAHLDWLDAYEEFLFGELDRAGFLRAFIWDVTLTGATPTEVEERARKITVPKAGSARVHNENEVWKAETPTLQAADSGAAARVFRNHILGGATIPPTWFADGEDSNRATSQSMAEPTEKVLEMRQRIAGYMLNQVAVFVLRSRMGILDAEPSDDQQKILDGVRVEWPEMTTSDTTKYASAMSACVAAAVAAINANLFTRETALRVVATMAAQLGVEIDVEEELTNAEKAAKDKSAEDSFVPGKMDDEKVEEEGVDA